MTQVKRFNLFSTSQGVVIAQLLVLMLGFALSSTVLASGFASNTSPDPYVIIQNFSTITVIVRYMTLILGIMLFVFGMFRLKRYGESRTMMSQQMTIASPLFTMIAGVLLIWFSGSLTLLLSMFWGTASPLQYTPSDLNAGYFKVIIVFIRLVGMTAVIRGIVLLARVGSQGAQAGTTGKSLMHIFGGILMMHIIGSFMLVEQILQLTL